VATSSRRITVRRKIIEYPIKQASPSKPLRKRLKPGGFEKSAEGATVRQRIIDFLSKRSGPVTPLGIAKGTGLNRHSVRRELQMMYKVGDVTKHKNHGYRLLTSMSDAASERPNEKVDQTRATSKNTSSLSRNKMLKHRSPETSKAISPPDEGIHHAGIASSGSSSSTPRHRSQPTAKRNWGPFRPKVLGIHRLEMLEKYLQGSTDAKIVRDDYPGLCTPKRVNECILDAAKSVYSLSDILRKLIEQGYRFRPSHAIAIDWTNPPFDNLNNPHPIHPSLAVVSDAKLPRAPYALGTYVSGPTKRDILNLLTDFIVLLPSTRRRKIREYVIDGSTVAIGIIPEIQELLPKARPQLSWLQTKMYITRELPTFNVEDPNLRTLREITRKSSYAILDNIENAKLMRSWIDRLRLLNAHIDDKAVNKVLDYLNKMSKYLTTYAQLGVRIADRVKATSQDEGIFSELETRIQTMHGFKSFDSMRYITNAYLGHRMFESFTFGQHAGMRPVDLFFRPQVTGAWTDYCFSKPTWDL